MKSSEWIKMIWDTVPEAQSIDVRGGHVNVIEKNNCCLLTVPEESLKLDLDIPLCATRTSETERLSVEVWDDRLIFKYNRGVALLIVNALCFPNFLGYELADGTISPRLEAGMNVVAVHFKKG